MFTMRQIYQVRALMFVTALVGFSPLAQAVPYASQVRNTGGTNFEFVLNEGADSITINRTGDTPIVINAPAAGRHTFAATGAFQIEVGKNASAAWSEISSAANLWTNFQRPTGLA